MEGSSCQSQTSDRSRPPYPRTASRSSTSSTRTRMSNNSAASSQQLAPTSSSRHPYSRTSRPPTLDRPRSQLSREASEQQSRESLPTMSTYLQERLERERRVNDSDRSSSRASNDGAGASIDIRAVQSSPPRKSPAEGRRPRSSGGTEPAKKKGLGLKEMEQTLSTLHKQNFDLKLELFHRREKQTALEERVEKLESEKSRTDEMNDQLIQELEKRDKAVEEAVAMIVVLEARVEQLIREREMVRRVEQDGLFFTRSETPRPEATHKSNALELPQFDDVRALNRMPSFLSEQSENTANLRNVYLGVRGSVLSLPRMAEDSHEAERMEHNGVSSPTLSVLSESSFLSVYGERKAAESSSPPDDSPPSADRPGRTRGPSVSESIASVKSSTPGKQRQSSASRYGPNQFQNIHDILDMGGSPLQRLERLEMALTAMGDASRPPTSSQEKDMSHISRPIQAVSQPKTKQEKRDALEKVLTQGHLIRDFSHTHGLPPTPDTISTSTLRRFKNSNDTLSREQSLSNERSYLALSETTASQVSGIEGGAHPGLPEQTTQPASTTAFDSRKQFLSNGAPVDRGLSPSPPLRPKSASGTTVSKRRSKGGWDSDDSDDEFNEVDSMASSFDPWLRESLKPNRPDVLDPMSSASQAGPNKQASRASPDLFSFPVSSGGWAADAMYGHLGGAAYMGAMGSGISPAPMAEALDALGSSLPAPYFGSGFSTPVIGSSNVPPPPPNRRSSLHAQTGPTSSTYGSGSNPASPARPSPMSSKLKKSPTRRNRSNSIDLRPLSSNLRDLGLRQDRSMTVPPKQHHLPPPAQEPQDIQPPVQQMLPKQRHYPPTASQAPRPRGLNSLFRRSTGSAEPPQLAPPSSAPATETTFKNLPPQMGFPSCGKRSSLIEDERASATPPPILRNKAQQKIDLDEGGGAPLESGGAPIGNIPGPARPYTSGPNSGTANGVNVSTGAPANPPAASRNEGGGKLKWLGLGRVSSLRNRGA